MANETTGAIDSKAEKKQIKDERKRLKEEEKKQKKEIKARAKEISKREAQIEDEEEKGNGVSSFIVTTVIVAIWIAILCLLIKLDVGGFGSEILTPLLKDVPVLNLILPGEHGPTETTEEGAIEGYTSLREAVDTIKTLELLHSPCHKGFGFRKHLFAESLISPHGRDYDHVRIFPI